jgi:flagellar protein FliO/FliZ
MMPPSAPPGPANKSVSFKILAGVGFVVVCLGLFAPRLIPPPGGAEPAVNPVAAPTEPNPTPWGTLLKMTLGVGMVAVAWLAVARYVGRKAPQAVTSHLGVEASLAIDPRCVLHLVRVGERRLLVGSDSSGVKAVVELPAGGREAPVIGPVRVSVASEPDPADLVALLSRN